MGNRLKNKIAIVTAAGQGIGKATAIAFYKEGAEVIATDLNEVTLESLNKEYPDIKIKKLDSTDNNSIIELLKREEENTRFRFDEKIDYRQYVVNLKRDLDEYKRIYRKIHF